MKEDVNMRVISGKYKGRKIDGFDIEGTRPTQDRIKESLFGIIQEDLVDSIVLDLFSGSGNLGIEALSNGASKCYLNDINKECIKVIKNNLNGIENAYVLNMDYISCLDYLKDKEKFNIIFLDPPYNLDCLDKVINKIIENNLLQKDGLIICEYEHDNFKEYDKLEIIKDKKYGYKRIKIYKYYDK